LSNSADEWFETAVRNYLIVDASLNGTGIRDKYNGGYVDPDELPLSAATKERLKEWVLNYAKHQYHGFSDDKITTELDSEGKQIALAIKSELLDIKIEYFSNARSSEFI